MFIDNFTCDWCKQEIGDYYLTADHNKLRFCNFICAKHYNDLIHKVIVDMDKYTNYYINGKLSKFNEKIYKFVSKRGFEFMPTIYNKTLPTDEQARRDMVKYYITKIYERK